MKKLLAETAEAFNDYNEQAVKISGHKGKNSVSLVRETRESGFHTFRKQFRTKASETTFA